MRFTDPNAPLFIDLDGDLVETSFVIATNQAAGPPPTRERETPQPRGQKRDRDTDTSQTGTDQSRDRSVSAVPTSARKVKPMKAAVRVDRVAVARDPHSGSRGTTSSVRGSMPPPSLPPLPALNVRGSTSRRRATSVSVSEASVDMPPPQTPTAARRGRSPEPLFLPSSQVSIAHLSQAANVAIRDSGLGIEGMDENEFLDMLEGDGEEIAVVPASQAQEMEMDVSMIEDEPNPEGDGPAGSFGIYDGDEDTQLGPTQSDSPPRSSGSKVCEAVQQCWQVS